MRAYDSIKAERGREVTLETLDFLERARQLLSSGVAAEIKMSGSSMRPTIEDGDIITLVPLNDIPVKQGDIVLLQTRVDTAVIHRVVRIDRSSSERIIVTRGDAAQQNDVPVPAHRVLGKVKQIERAGENVRISKPNSGLFEKMYSMLKRLRFWA